MKPGKTVRIVGDKPLPKHNALTNLGPDAPRPTKLRYAQVSTEAPNTTVPSTISASRIEDVFIPFYDRPGFTTDNAAQATRDGKMYKIPAGNGTMPEQEELGV